MVAPSLPSVSLPSVSLPSVSLPNVDVSAATDRVGDVVAAGVGTFQNVAVSAFDLASDLASAAADRFDDLPEKVVGLAGVAIPALRPQRRSRRPLLLIVAAVAALVAAGWFIRRRRAAAETALPSDRFADGTTSVSAAS